MALEWPQDHDADFDRHQQENEFMQKVHRQEADGILSPGGARAILKPLLRRRQKDCHHRLPPLYPLTMDNLRRHNLPRDYPDRRLRTYLEIIMHYQQNISPSRLDNAHWAIFHPHWVYQVSPWFRPPYRHPEYYLRQKGPTHR